MKKVLLLIILLLPVLISEAQGYKQAIGIRGGLSSGFEYRMYTDDANSYKFLLSTRNQGVQLHALREFHRFDLFDFSEQLVFFYGAGVHVGFESWNEAYYLGNERKYNSRNALLAGLDGLAGVEYVFYEVPVSVGLEVKPFFDVFGKNPIRVQPFDFAFTVKYLF
jgi:hypothetical protein